MIREKILEKLFPEYKEVKNIIESCSDYELGIAIDDIFEIDNLADNITKSIQYKIIDDLIKPIIDNEDFIYNEEAIIWDYCYSIIFMERDYYNKSYKIYKQQVINMCEEMIKESGKDIYKVNENIDFGAIIAKLNKFYPLKFVEV